MTELSENAFEIAKSRYFWDNETKWSQLAERICKENSKNEKENQERYYEDFMSIIEPMYFIPAGRILRNLGKKKPSTTNCNALPIEDNIESIFETLKNYGIISAHGGGNGINFSNLRPKGSPMITRGGESSGMVSFIEIFNYAGSKLETGGQRRAAGIALCSVYHPEVIDFIDAKIEHNKLNQFNISVIVDNYFLKAVEDNLEWELKFAGKVYNTVKARYIWDKILNNIINHSEPGIIFEDNLKKNNTYYFAPVNSVNPCVTGDTKIAVADGRENVSIKQLVNEGKDVPVFCYTGKDVVVRMMRNPRITGYNKKILKIILDDGSSIKCTENHKILTKLDGYIEARNLKTGDRLHHTIKYNSTFYEIFKTSNSKATEYIWWNTGRRSNKAEHRIVAEFFNGKIPKNNVVHHIDFNSLNNEHSNLLVLPKKEHDKLHGDKMIGDNNPMRRFPEKVWFKGKDFSGEKNSRYMGVTPEGMFNHCVILSKQIKRKPSTLEWREYCILNNIPCLSKYSYGKYKKYSTFSIAAAKEANVVIPKSAYGQRKYKEFLKLKEETDLNIRFDFNTNHIIVTKICEYCNNTFEVLWGRREQCFCSLLCSGKANINDTTIKKQKEALIELQKIKRNKQLKVFKDLYRGLKRIPFKQEWEKQCKLENIPFRLRGKKYKLNNPYVFKTYKELKEEALSLNYIIVSIEECGYEDVYNGTVDEFHNFFINTSESKTKSNKRKLNYINTLQCGELPLEDFGVCNLGSLILPKFVTNVNTDWKKLEDTIYKAVRFMDNIIDLAFYPIPKQEEVAKNARRIGLGSCGLADYLFAKKIRYGSEKSIQEIEKLYKFIRDTVYLASIELAKEKGAFPKYNKNNYMAASFIKKLPAKIRMKIKEYTIRNATLLTAPPTGSTSLLADVSSGIEPIPFKGYRRVDGVGERIYIHPLAIENVKEDWFVDSLDLTPEEHLEVQVAIQKYLDGSISKTLILPEKTTVKDLDKYVLEYLPDLKGLTAYRNNSREKQVYYRLSEKEIKKHIKENNITSNMNEEDVQCKSGSCEL